MKLSYEAYGEKSIIEIDHDDVNIEEIYEMFQRLLLSAGFHPNIVERYFISDNNTKIELEKEE